MMPDAIEIFNLGVNYFEADDLKLALEAFDRAIEIDPSLAVAHNGRAVVHALNGALHRAIAESTEALRLDPSEPKFYRTRGLIYRELGDAKSAESDLEQAKRLGYRPSKKA